jgi:hypothetical protein
MQLKKSGDSKKFWNLATRKPKKHFLFAIFSPKQITIVVKLGHRKQYNF